MRSPLAWLLVVLVLGGTLATRCEAQQTPPITPAPVTPTPPAPAAPSPPSPPLPPLPEPPPDLSAPLPSSPGALTLQDTITQALENQPEVLARLKDYDAARFRVDEAMSVLLPQLTAVSSATKSQSVIVQTTPSTGVTSVFTSNREFQQTFNAQLQFSQVLFDFGQNGAAVQAARKTADASLSDYANQRLQLSDTVKEAYTNINLARHLIAVAQQSLDRARLNLESARGLADVGAQPYFVVTRAEVDVANAEVALIQARNAEEVARVALNTAMGIAVDTPTEVQDNLIYEPVNLDSALLHETALAQRPEYRQAKLRADAFRAVVRQWERSFLPTISGNSFFGGSTTSLNQAWAATLSMTWRLFDGGNIIASLREAKANLAAAELRIKATALTVAQQVEQARVNVREAAQRIEAAKAAVASARETYRLALGRFEVRVGTILELTDAQLALTQAQQTQAQALADYRIGLARLDLAVGRE
jgi:outer membrane protein